MASLIYENGSAWSVESIDVELARIDGFKPWDDFSRSYMAEAFLVLPPAGLLFGRSRQTAVPMLLIKDANVARRHAAIEPRGDGWWLRDLGSACGTPVNGQRTSGPRLLGCGDSISIGGWCDRRLIFVDRWPDGPSVKLPPYLRPQL